MEITITYRRGEVPMTKWDDAFQRQLECRLGETTGGQTSVQRRLLAAQRSLVDALQEIVGREPFTLKLVVTGEAPEEPKPGQWRNY